MIDFTNCNYKSQVLSHRFSPRNVSVKMLLMNHHRFVHFKVIKHSVQISICFIPIVQTGIFHSVVRWYDTSGITSGITFKPVFYLHWVLNRFYHFPGIMIFSRQRVLRVCFVIYMLPQNFFFRNL